MHEKIQKIQNGNGHGLSAAGKFLPAVQTGCCCFSTDEFSETDSYRSGHGEDDPGMIGADGLEEKGINLAISLLLKSELETRGYSVAMTRETDKGLYDASANNKKAQDMQRRIAMIGEKSPVLSVSIHQNSYQQDASVHGPQVFYYEVL